VVDPSELGVVDGVEHGLDLFLGEKPDVGVALGLPGGGPRRRPDFRPAQLFFIAWRKTPWRNVSLFWMRSAWWCRDCRQKIESYCEGGGCPSIADAR
jgi:hypothetical protein